MKLHEHIQRRMNLISRYGPEGIEVNGELHPGPVMVAPGFLQAASISATQLSAEHMAPAWRLEARILLIGGSGFVPGQIKQLRRTLAGRDLAVEVMDLGAACRTYNVLAQEERPVVALLFPA
jgi:uncharacterized protein